MATKDQARREVAHAVEQWQMWSVWLGVAATVLVFVGVISNETCVDLRVVTDCSRPWAQAIAYALGTAVLARAVHLGVRSVGTYITWRITTSD